MELTNRVVDDATLIKHHQNQGKIFLVGRHPELDSGSLFGSSGDAEINSA